LNAGVLFAAMERSSSPPYTSTSSIPWMGNRCAKSTRNTLITSVATSSFTIISLVCEVPSNPQ